jgi:hypothetical protein
MRALRTLVLTLISICSLSAVEGVASQTCQQKVEIFVQDTAHSIEQAVASFLSADAATPDWLQPQVRSSVLFCCCCSCATPITVARCILTRVHASILAVVPHVRCSYSKSSQLQSLHKTSRGQLEPSLSGDVLH